MPAHTPNILLSPEARVHFLASADTLLRGWWRIARPQHWLFTAERDASLPLNNGSAQRWYHGARAAAVDGGGAAARSMRWRHKASRCLRAAPRTADSGTPASNEASAPPRRTASASR